MDRRSTEQIGHKISLLPDYLNFSCLPARLWLTKSHLTGYIYVYNCADSAIPPDLKRFYIWRIESCFPSNFAVQWIIHILSSLVWNLKKGVPLWPKKVLNLSSAPSPAPTPSATVASCMILRNPCPAVRRLTVLLCQALLSNTGSPSFEMLFLTLKLLGYHRKK